ncbi:MAG: anti-sigma factor [bacterium]|nr:anti-sigma factor [bacterium]
MKCHDIKNRLELYLDNELPVQEKAAIEAHLLTCSDCTKEFANLKSINSLGKTDLLPQPSPSYWKESRQHIMNAIKATDKKPIRLPALLQKFKNYIFLPKLSFRLAGLVATAVIVFFIIHISFLREGKFELPQKIELHDSITPPEPVAQSIEVKDEEERETTVPQEAPVAISFQDKGSGKLSAQQNEQQAIVNFADHEIRNLPAPAKLLEQESDVEAGKMDRKKGISDEAAPSQKDAMRMAAKPAYTSHEKKEIAEKAAFHVQSVGASKSTTLPDTSIVNFRLTHQKALAVHEIIDKIKIWEDYVQTQPELELLSKAKYEQSRLYFDLAQAKMNEAQVTQAIQFYEKNFDHLIAIADTSQIELELAALRQLLQKK